MRRFTAPFFLLLFFVLFAATSYLAPHIGNGTVRTDSGPAEPLQLPYSLKTPGKQTLHYRIDLYKSPLASSLLKIIPDDCIEALSVNGVPYDVGRISGRCDWSHGATVDISDALRTGDNTLELTVAKKDGVGGLNVFGLSDPSAPAATAMRLLTFLSLGIGIFLLAGKRLSFPLALLLTAAATLQFHYLGYTDYATRTFDLLISTGHLDYIKMIAHRFTLPNPTGGWEYHQPPLYYLLAAAVYRLAETLPVLDPMRALQLLSFSLFTVFMYYGLRTLERIVPDRIVLTVVGALLVFWPSGVIHSVRIGNDILFYALFAAGTYRIVLWQLGEGTLRPALLAAALALITKANGIILFGVIGFLLLFELRRRRDLGGFLRQSAVAAAFFAAAFFVNFADNIYFALQNNGQDWLVSNVVNILNRSLFVDNHAFNYLYFDLKTYLGEPFIDAWHDRYGRQFFWNYLLKSALFSEFFFRENAESATVISALSLIVYGYILWGMAIARRNRATLVMALVFLLSVTALLLYRIKIPVACNTDFRYIYPVLIPMSYFFAQSLLYFRDSRRLKNLYGFGIFTALLFVAASALFFV